MTDPQNQPRPRPKASLWDTVKAVGWSFFGVRKNSVYQEDLGKLNPLHIIAVAFVAVIVFVVALVLLVRHVVASAAT
ncbi:Protein of unknown function [Variovorax sp. YR752]|uniref:DUF2970 domain-containing protein n=1 Tax=Variovorax sp. YR752 TaxID=1884383 RepID=UPI000BC576BE|nr:DUF2970 domain-containing protein [Variovorax sp. YR752]SOD24405.1 Protein of unknown function [Variovorax sp. YR752]